MQSIYHSAVRFIVTWIQSLRHIIFRGNGNVADKDEDAWLCVYFQRINDSHRPNP